MTAAEKNAMSLRAAYADRKDLVENGEIIEDFVRRVDSMVWPSTDLSAAKGARIVFEAIVETKSRIDRRTFPDAVRHEDEYVARCQVEAASLVRELLRLHADPPRDAVSKLVFRGPRASSSFRDRIAPRVTDVDPRSPHDGNAVLNLFTPRTR